MLCKLFDRFWRKRDFLDDGDRVSRVLGWRTCLIEDANRQVKKVTIRPFGRIPHRKIEILERGECK